MGDPGGRAGPTPDPGFRPRRHRNNWSLLLLLIPFAALLYPPFYAHLHPELGGIPFFIWYQFAAVLVGSAVTGLVYSLRRVRDEARPPEGPAPAGPSTGAEVKS
jgi:hypothetical protein